MVETKKRKTGAEEGAGMSYRLECKYKGAGLTHYVMQSEDAPF